MHVTAGSKTRKLSKFTWYSSPRSGGLYPVHPFGCAYEYNLQYLHFSQTSVSGWAGFRHYQYCVLGRVGLSEEK